MPFGPFFHSHNKQQNVGIYCPHLDLTDTFTLNFQLAVCSQIFGVSERNVGIWTFYLCSSTALSSDGWYVLSTLPSNCQHKQYTPTRRRLPADLSLSQPVRNNAKTSIVAPELVLLPAGYANNCSANCHGHKSSLQTSVCWT